MAKSAPDGRLPRGCPSKIRSTKRLHDTLPFIVRHALPPPKRPRLLPSQRHPLLLRRVRARAAYLRRRRPPKGPLFLELNGKDSAAGASAAAAGAPPTLPSPSRSRPVSALYGIAVAQPVGRRRCCSKLRGSACLVIASATLAHSLIHPIPGTETVREHIIRSHLPPRLLEHPAGRRRDLRIGRDAARAGCVSPRKDGATVRCRRQTLCGTSARRLLARTSHGQSVMLKLLIGCRSSAEWLYVQTLTHAMAALARCRHQHRKLRCCAPVEVARGVEPNGKVRRTSTGSVSHSV